MPGFLYPLVAAAVGSTLAAAIIPSIDLERSPRGLAGVSHASQEERTQLPAAPLAKAPSSRTQDACETAENLNAVRACIYQQHDQEVGARFKEVRHAINALSETADNKLDQAQIAWRNFMEASCDYRAEAVPEGVYPEDTRINCTTDFMVARIRVLDAYQREFRKLPQSDR